MYVQTVMMQASLFPNRRLFQEVITFAAKVDVNNENRVFIRMFFKSNFSEKRRHLVVAREL